MSGVAVVICAYAEERLPRLRQAVASVAAQTVPASAVVVAIDHNPRLLKLARASLQGVTVLANPGPRGAGEARNAGAAAVPGASILAFLDDDARAAPDWIERALPAFEQPRVMGVGGTIRADWEAPAPGWFPAEFNWAVGCTYPGLPEQPAPVRNLIAASMFVRAEVFAELGGFRRGFGKQGARSRPEETDLCLRANARWPQRLWLHDPAVAVSHAVPPSRGRVGYFLSRCYHEGRGKADLTGFAGSSAALAAERRYTRHTLPAGFAAGVREAAGGGGAQALARSAAIVAGLGAAGAGYACGRLLAGAGHVVEGEGR